MVIKEIVKLFVKINCFYAFFFFLIQTCCITDVNFPVSNVRWDATIKEPSNSSMFKERQFQLLDKK